MGELGFIRVGPEETVAIKIKVLSFPSGGGESLLVGVKSISYLREIKGDFFVQMF